MVDIKAIAKEAQKTIKLYLEDPYIRELECELTNIYWEKGGKAYLTLNETIFHPRSGGQDCDLGWIQNPEYKFQILKVFDVEDVVIHYCKLQSGDPSRIKAKSDVKCILDWERRYKNMKLHTAGHILDYAVAKAYGMLVETLNANHSPPDAYLEYKANPPTNEKLKTIIEEANKIVKENRSVKWVWVEAEKLNEVAFNAPNLARLPKSEKYRVIIIDGVNGIPCTGTHTSKTGEIGEIKIIRVEPTTMGFKLHYDTN